MTALAFDERFALLVDAEWRARENKRLTRALQDAKLKLSHACLEAIDYPARRELDKAVIRQLATCRWVAEHQGVLITGMTGTGKSFIACALAHQACRKGYRALYRRASRLFHELTLARADGTYVRLLGKLARRTCCSSMTGPWPRPGPGAPRPARDPRGPLRHPVDHHHQPAAADPVARLHRRADAGRRHLRPPPAQRPPNRATRTLTTKGGQARQLTAGRPASLRSDHDPPIGAITMLRSG